VELSQEDRDRIFQEEKVRGEVRARLEAEEKAKKATKARYGCGGCLGLIVLSGMVFCWREGRDTG
jgi:hypothetical protein